MDPEDKKNKFKSRGEQLKELSKTHKNPKTGKTAGRAVEKKKPGKK